MDAACSTPGYMLLQEKLVVHLPHHDAPPGPEWASIECSSKEAYGCGKLAEKLLKGLTLYVRRVGDSSVLNSSLSICLGDVALRSIQEELGVPGEFQGVEGCLPEVDGAIKIVHREVLVLMVIFRRRNHTKRAYYLVYDAKDSSLYMIPYIPEDLEATFTLTPVPARLAGVQGHVLAIMARKIWPHQRAERDHLCVSTPSTRAKPARDSTGCPWAIKVHSFPKLPQAFSADVMFSFEDKVFWADLSQGVAYIDLRQGSSAVFIELPYGYHIDLSALPTFADIEPANMTRTMGWVGGSIKFVCISRDEETRIDHDMVRVWTLDLDHRQWKEDRGFPCLWKDFWKQACQMDSKLNHLLTLDPQFPVLTSDGALSLLLPNRNNLLRRCGIKEADYICGFDMASKSCLCFGHVCNYDSIEPVILPYNFFKNSAPLEGKMPTPERKLLSVVQPCSKEGILVEEAS
ncbi:unnamed protein product [Urochloa humidicola]